MFREDFIYDCLEIQYIAAVAVNHRTRANLEVITNVKVAVTVGRLRIPGRSPLASVNTEYTGRVPGGARRAVAVHLQCPAPP